ncbi:hypothetical protein ACFVHW_04420 [Streptomyces sp. NPDC127110]|uniref:hypothetical protein n=1 Tax=Streptomyces sp. NPDC127110 TaxID=3345362 RepID=UPI003624EB09
MVNLADVNTDTPNAKEASMAHARLADQINRLPFEMWLRADEGAQRIGLPTAEAETVLRAGRRCGMLTVRRIDGAVEFMRVRRRPAAPRSLTRSWPEARESRPLR